MKLDQEASAILNGVHGEEKRKAMDALIQFGEAFNAQEMVRIGYAHVAAGQPMYRDDMAQVEALAESGVRVVVPTSVNIANADMRQGASMNAPRALVKMQQRSEPAHQRLGTDPCFTCTPYWAGHWPTWNTHMVSLESTVTIFCNSVLGARCNRDGYFAVYAAVTGYYPKFGYHLDENRVGTHLVEIDCALENPTDFSCLGYAIGLRCVNSVPVLTGLRRRPTLDELDAMGAAMATSGSVAMFILPGVTPPYQTVEQAFGGRAPPERFQVGQDDIDAVYADFSAQAERNPSIVHLGCPHASMTEMREYAFLLEGKKANASVELWITTSRAVRQMAEQSGLVTALEAAGAKVLSDTCPIMCHLSRIMAPEPSLALAEPRNLGMIVVDSAKQAKYLRDTVACHPVLLNTADAVHAAVHGRLLDARGSRHA